MATINCSDFMGPIEIGSDEIGLDFTIETTIDESSLTITSRQISGRLTLEYNNIDYWANVSYYGRFNYKSISSFEKSKIT